ncbi:uncharacterized protein MONBRDRAFT_38141 [Monosiga brevicollis MX1]|uniref:Thioredoxin domain-containing protein n=1 Tax=Monosiga brevicollis TaxID=81824 RepID=A9V5X6_MONBE|nr:uncharacterized protein MONBRDRAFT_38141 [Monosiga brevicollis MX1]EDQ87187.1 predicted protein [Monosiga brevicollis MX1]|eukprot:XP_001748130.1 hypothetical protein [Monosiga brevicollis MX1]
MTAIDVKDATALKTVLTDAGGALVVVHFWADWAPQCQQMDAVMAELHKAYPTIKLARVEAEALADVSEEYEIMAVPTMLLFKLSKVVDRVNGANAPELSAKVQKHQAVVAQVPKLAEVAVEDPKLSLNDKLHKLINAAPMMLFMKGTADEPQCGFSRTMVELLRSVDAEFSTFNILADDEVRQGLKTYSNWQTYPQLYINGELIGGLDVVKLNPILVLNLTVLPPPLSPPYCIAIYPCRLAALIRRAPVMLFMKGTPDEPR